MAKRYGFSKYRPTPANVTSPLALTAPVLMVDPQDPLDPVTGDLADVRYTKRSGKMISKHRAKHRGKVDGRREAADRWHELRDERLDAWREARRAARRDEPMDEFEELDPEAFDLDEDEDEGTSGLVTIGHVGDLDDAVYDSLFLRLSRGARYGG